MTATVDRPTSAASSPRPIYAGRKRGPLRRLIYLSLAILLIAACSLLAAAWYFSSQLLDVTHNRSTYPLQVLAIRGQTVELIRSDGPLTLGTFRLAWERGRTPVGTILSPDQRGILRWVGADTAGLKVGTRVSVDIHLYASPAAFHLPYRSVNVPDPLGPMPAWYIPGRRHTWVLEVHGYKSDRTEGLRPLPVLASLGLPVLDLSYRNDVGAPSSPDHLYHLGATEWVDLQAGVRYALTHGAHDVILYGYSMGGAIVEYFLRHSPYAGRVRAVVLDSPVLDWNAVLDLQASERSLPGVLTMIAKRIVGYRLGLPSLEPLDTVRAAAQLRAPTLLFQGTSDQMVPIGPSTSLARARPDLVTYITVLGADHTQEWNVDPAAYDFRLKTFLEHVLR